MLKNYKKQLSLLFALFLLFAFSACTTLSKTEAKNVLIKHNSRMFWEIKGEKSSIFIQGTIHFGNDNLYPLEQEVLSAFLHANKHYAEISSQDLQQVAMQATVKIMAACMNVEKSKRASSSLTSDEMDFLRSLANSRPELSSFSQFIDSAEPWVLYNLLQLVFYDSTEYDSKKGLDLYLYGLAANKNFEVLGLDEPKTQLELLDFGTYEEQVFMLKEAIKDYRSGQAKKSLDELFTYYLAGDAEKIKEVSDKDLNAYPIDLKQKYEKLLLVDRNKKWAESFEKLLDAGEDVFVFAGSLHFIGEKSVFALMKEKGSLR